MTRKRYVFAYVNPDTDGVACSIAFNELARSTGGGEFEPVVWGVLNGETEFVLARFDATRPRVVTELVGDYSVVLVDTHHPQQLPSELDLARVSAVIDHHPAGHPEAFPGAAIQNEQVGAAATLLVERFQQAGVEPSAQTGGLLAAAIISNTLNMTAPSTAERDRRALSWLRERVSGLDESFVREMFTALSDVDDVPTAELLVSNMKSFRTGSQDVGIVQIETTDPVSVLRRADLRAEFASLESSSDAAHFFLSIVDIVVGRTTLVALSSSTREMLTKALNAQFHDAGYGDLQLAEFPRIMLRKTDLVPGLAAIL